jgi:hypothetical protein
MVQMIRRRFWLPAVALSLGAAALAIALPASASAAGSPQVVPAASAAPASAPSVPTPTATVSPSPSGYRTCSDDKGPLYRIYYRDRFHACFLTRLGVINYECKKHVCVKVGGFSVQWEVVGTGRNNKQLMDYTVKSFPLPGISDVFPPYTSQKVIMGLACLNAASSKCASNHSGFTDTEAEWLLPHTFAYQFTTSAAGAGDKVPNTRDKVNFHAAIAYLYLASLTPRPAYYGPGVIFRGDAASYIYKGGAVFPQVLETYKISLSNARLAAVAAHIEAAYKSPGTGTKPPATGKVIPGFAKTGRPLTRLYPNYDLKLYKANRSTAVAACKKYFGDDYANGGKQCDEFPFASTYQGASTVSGRWWYSAFPVPGGQNGYAGTNLGAWLTANRILSGDPYWVEVTS